MSYCNRGGAGANIAHRYIAPDVNERRAELARPDQKETSA